MGDYRGRSADPLVHGCFTGGVPMLRPAVLPLCGAEVRDNLVCLQMSDSVQMSDNVQLSSDLQCVAIDNHNFDGVQLPLHQFPNYVTLLHSRY